MSDLLKKKKSLISWSHNGMSFVRILGKRYYVISAPHCTWNQQKQTIFSDRGCFPFYVSYINGLMHSTADAKKMQLYCWCKITGTSLLSNVIIYLRDHTMETSTPTIQCEVSQVWLTAITGNIVKACGEADIDGHLGHISISYKMSYHRILQSSIPMRLAIKMLMSLLTHLPLMLHICVSELGQHWFR